MASSLRLALLVTLALALGASARVEEPYTCEPEVCRFGVSLVAGDGVLKDGAVTVSVGSAAVQLLGVDVGAGTIAGFIATNGIRVEKIVVSSSATWTQNIYTYSESAEEYESHEAMATHDGSAIERVDICYHFHVLVDHSVETCYEKRYEWELLVSRESTVTGNVTIGRTQTYYWAVTSSVVKTEILENYKATGKVTVTNPDPENWVDVASVPVTFNGETFDADCHAPYPVRIAAGGALVCDYERLLPNPPPRAEDLPASSTASVVTAAGGAADFVGGAGAAVAPVAWETVCKVTNDCVEMRSTSGRKFLTCASRNATEYVEYKPNCTHAVKADLSEGYVLVDPATGAPLTPYDGVLITINVKCASGCTLTLGYWQTHSHHGPARLDRRWYLIDAVKGADATFFLNTRTYYQAMHEPSSTLPRGYYQLAQQYIAAKLNVLSGASSTSDVDGAINYAERYFNNRVSNPTYEQLVARATTLDRFNNGIIGPGHCDG